MNEAKKGFWGAMASTISETLGERTKPLPKEPEIEAQEFLEQAKLCLDSRRTRHERLSMAAALAAKLRSANDALLGELIAALSIGLGAQKDVLSETLASVDWADVDMARIESTIGAALGGRRRKLAQLWLSMDGALEFLVWLREQTLKRSKLDQAVAPLRDDLDALMGEVFAQGLLQMRPITWRSPALVLEKLMIYEQVHEMRSWGDMKARLDQDRRIFALFHSGWADEPLAFLEVALTKGLSKSTASIFEQAEPLDSKKADTATFYSINSPHPGLKGISFGEDLIRKAVEALRQEFPNIKTFGTLSPIPGFSKWLGKLSPEMFASMCGPDALEKLSKKLGDQATKRLVEDWGRPDWISTPLAEHSREILEKLCAKYLSGQGVGPGESDPVANFHLGNGARVEALRHLADLSPKGLAQSRGMMVNYLYELDELEKNKISRGNGAMAASWSIRRLAQG